MKMLIDHPYILNLIIIGLLLCYICYKQTEISLFFALIVYTSFHFCYGLLPVIFKEYTGTHYLEYRFNSDAISRDLAFGFLNFIIGLMLYKVYRQYQKKKFSLDQFKLLIVIVVAFILFWFMSVGFYWTNQHPDALSIKFFIIKNLFIFAFIVMTPFCFLMTSRLNDIDKKNFANLVLVLTIVMTALASIEFLILNQNKQFNCVSYGDNDCVYRSTGTLFNPNNLAIWYVFAGMVLTYFNSFFLSTLKWYLGIFSIAFGIYLSGSRSVLLIFFIYYMSALTLIFFSHKQDFISLFKQVSIFCISLGLIIVVPFYMPKDGRLTNSLIQMSERYISIFEVIKKHASSMFHSNANNVNELSASISGRISIDSTDNTYLYHQATEGVISLLIWLLLFSYIIKILINNYKNNKDINNSFLLASVITILSMGMICNLYSSYPAWIYFSILCAVSVKKSIQANLRLK